MSKSKIFVGICLSFAAGVGFGSRFSIDREILFLALGLLIAVFGVSFAVRRKYIALAALFLIFSGLGLLRIYAAEVPNQYQNTFGSKQQLEGYIVEEPDVRQNEQLLTVRPKNFSQNILLFTTFEQQYFYGQEVVVSCKPEAAQSFDNFDYPHYLERYNIYALCKYPEVLILKNNQLNPVKFYLLKIKSGFVNGVSQMLPQPQSSLLLAILLGMHKTLPQNIADNFNNTGLAHILAVDGYKVSILVTLLAPLSYLVGRRVGFALTLAALVVFVIITGAPASVLRAAIMGFLLLLSFNLGRQYSALPAICLAGAVMVCINPKILFWDVGFQLSFASTLGIVYFMPQLEKLTESWPNFLNIKTVFLITLCAIISTLPLVLLNFGSFSLWALPANLLVLVGILPATMLFGFLSVLPFLGAGFAFVASWFLLYILKVADFFAHLSYGNLQGTVSAWGFWGITAAIFALYFLLKFLANRKLSPQAQMVEQSAEV